MGYPSKGSSYLELTNDTSMAKTDGEKLKLFAEQLKSVFATKIDLKNKNLEREIRNFLILNVQDYSPLKSVHDHEEFISINELDRIIKNLDIKKVPGLDSISSKLIKYLKPALLKFLHFFFNLWINFGIHPANWKIAKVIMLHKAGKPEDLAGSYRPLGLTSCVGKLLEKAVADSLSNWTEANKKFNKQQNGFTKNRSTNDSLFKLFETIKLGFCKGHLTTGIFLDVEKAFDQVWYDGPLFKLTSMGLNGKLIRWISNFLYQRKLIISINDQLSDPITSIHGVPQGSPLSPILLTLYVNDIPELLDAQVNLSQFADDIAIWVQAPDIRSINLKLQKYLNQILTWCDRWRIKLNPGKTHLINFSQRNFIKDPSITMYRHSLKITESLKFLGVHIDNHLSMKQHIEYTERAFLISRMRIARLNSVISTLLIRLCKIFTGP